MPDILIIGGGHNSLVNACYLAKAGHNVRIFESTDKVGGLCINEEVWPGYVVSPWANWSGMLQPQIIDDLELTLPEIIEEASADIMASGDFITGDKLSIKNLSNTDQDQLARYERDTLMLAEVLQKEFLNFQPSCDNFLKNAARLNLPYDINEFIKESALNTVTQYTAHPALCALSAIGTFLHPLHPGSAYGSIYMRIPETFEKNNYWGLVRGGMGKITEILKKRALELGVEIFTDMPVIDIVFDAKKIQGIKTENDQMHKADIYIAGCDYGTVQNLLKRKTSPLRNGHHYGVANIHIKLSDLPTFKALKDFDHSHISSYNLVPELSDLKNDYKNYVSNGTLQHSVYEIGIPTIADPSRAPGGKHMMCVHINYAPLNWQGSNDWSEQHRASYVDHVFQKLEYYIPELRDCVEDWQLFCAKDMQASYGAADRHCFHGDLSWDFALDQRTPEYGAGPQTDLDNFYLCGSACAPGGTVTGAPGYRCAQALLN